MGFPPQGGGGVASLELDPTPSTDHSYSGFSATFTAGENLAFGDACYCKAADGKMWKADADALATMPATGLATDTIAANAEGLFFLYGYMRDDSWAWTVNGFLYGHTTPGNLTQTRPPGAGDQVQVCGVAVSADVLFFFPTPVLVKVS